MADRLQEGPSPSSSDVEASDVVEHEGAGNGNVRAEHRHEIPFGMELRRKALHLLSLVLPACMLVLGRPTTLAILLPLSAVALFCDVLRVRSKGFANWLYGLFGFMMRPEECPPVGGRPTLNGATWVLISASLVLIFFPVAIAAAAFASFMVADAAAAVVGRRFGRRKWGSTTRTVEGSLAFLLVALLIMLAFPSASVAAAVTAAAAGAAAEIPRGPLNDNVRVPLVMALVLAVWGV